MKDAGGAKTGDAELVGRFLDGDKSAFEELVRRYEGPLVHFLMRYVRDLAAAEEIFQETFVRVYRKAASFERDKHFKTWLYTIALNLARSAIKRKRSAGVVFSLEEKRGDKSPLRETVPSSEHGPEERAAASEVAREIEKAVASLSDNHREVFILYQYDGCAYDEIAKITRRPVGTIKSQMHYAIKELRQKLSHLQSQFL